MRPFLNRLFTFAKPLLIAALVPVTFMRLGGAWFKDTDDIINSGQRYRMAYNDYRYVKWASTEPLDRKYAWLPGYSRVLEFRRLLIVGMFEQSPSLSKATNIRWLKADWPKRKSNYEGYPF